ncbi:MAG: ribosome small subunit-dependent GTPase A [Chlamydia sp.]
MSNQTNLHGDDWDSHFDPSLRENRQERKRKQAKDRSKYKKTDQGKFDLGRLQDQEAAMKLLVNEPLRIKKGLITRIQSQDFQVLVDGELRIARLRGALRSQDATDKNLIVVGDEIVLRTEDDGVYTVEAVLSRRSVLCRQDNLNRVKRHLIAANIDQVFITTSIVNPHLRPSIIDRYLIAAQKGGISPILLINKMDLLGEAGPEEKELIDLVIKTYISLGIPVFQVSQEDEESMRNLKKAMKNSISVFSGQSGTGKSSLINALLSTNLKTGKTVERTRKGAHTTTFAQILHLPEGGMCVDTPGIKSFGIWELSHDDIRNGFPELQKCSIPCQFANCWHRGEKGCGVEKEIESEEGHSAISPIRYLSYLSLLSEIEEERARR